MAGSLTVTAQTAYPPRKLITATGLTNATFTIYRTVGGQRTAVRGAREQYIWPTTVFVVVDAEFPFATPVTYELEEAGVIVDTDGPTTTTLPGGLVALSDAINGLAAEVMIGTIDDLAGSTNSTVYNTDGLNRVVGSPLGQPSTVIEYLTLTLTARDDLRELLAGATANIIQQRGPDPAYDADCYLAILGTAERRFSQDGTDPRRITAVTAAYVTGWPTGLEAAGYTYQDVADFYTGLDYADVAADFATYLALAQGDFG
jgi:hypothetical protein